MSNTIPRSILVVVSIIFAFGCELIANEEDFFESKVRPLLIQRCFKCHSANEAKGGLKIDSREAVLQGGESGPAVIVGKPDESVMLKAVRHEDGLEMPPDGKLSPTEIDSLQKWILDGAVWPGAAMTVSPVGEDIYPAAMPKLPNSDDLRGALQLWLRADMLQLSDGESVPIWPDQSGRGRDLTATKGVREGGVGGPGNFVMHSTIVGRPAVRFSSWTGLASSPGNHVDIQGDASLTMMMVMNLSKFEGQPSHSTIVSVGNPAFAGDPGRPLAALIEIDQTQQFSLDFAGGWNHDAILAPGSYHTLFGKPVILSIVKKPGPINQTTRFYINGKLAGPLEGQPLGGRDTIPDIQHRSDIGVFLGKALEWCGAFQGDVGEVLLFNTALDNSDRSGVETYLGEKFGIWIDEERLLASKPNYLEKEKQHWAYQPLRRINPPAVLNEAWIRTPIDRFTVAAYAENLTDLDQEIDRPALLRRVSLDLIGLPPTAEEVDAFVKDTSPQAYENVVERLLDSPHYGERWGRHWLDLVRYAESTANDANAVMQYAWKYRNYVIDAFNNDLPYDQFIIEQLAGDLLPKTESIEVNTRRIIATGYLMIGPKALAETDKEQSRLDIVDDQIDVTGRAMLGMTIACARCHDHKFDAIRTTDYYAMAGIFRSTEPFQNEVRNATMWWEYPVPQGAGVEPIMVMAPKEAVSRNLRVHLRGNRFTLGKLVPRGALGIVAAVSHDGTEPNGPIVDPHQLSSGRLELARWIASPSNPLTARVLVNRVWQLHFGNGLVSTPDNFGTRGEAPTQPELLDWLAGEFIEGGWSVKKLHRLITLSSTYRRAAVSESAASSDVEKVTQKPLRFQRRRLSAEEIRDAMLMVSGQWDRSMGKSESGDFLLSKSEDIKAIIRPNQVGADDEFYTNFRKRSVYLPVVRNMLPDVMALFDAADPNSVTALRSETTVASQGLFLLNHPFAVEMAKSFATRVLSEPGLSMEDRIDLAHRIAFAREATDVERQETRELLIAISQADQLREQSESMRLLVAWQVCCQSLFCSNEFLYVN